MKIRIKKGLSVGEVIKKVYKKIKRHSYQEISFPDEEVLPGILRPTVLSLISDDSDDHRVRRGYMKHKSAVFLNTNGRVWTLSRGTAWGDYPIRPYDSHILAIEVIPNGKTSEEFISEIRDKIRGSWCFSNSVIGGRRDKDNLFVSEDNELGKKMWEFLIPNKISKFVVKKLKDNECSVQNHKWSSITGPFSIKYLEYKEPIRYKRKIVNYLTDAIMRLLSNF